MQRTRAQQGAPHVRESLHRQAGDFRSAYLGSGLDFEEARPYQPGDDVRGMDWRTTARTARAHIKIYREEHQPALHVVIDRGPSMRFGTRSRLKVTQAARIAATLGFGAAGANTCIGGTIWQPGTMTLPGRNGAAGAMQLAQAAIAPCPPLADPVAAAMPPFAELLMQLDALLARGSRVVLISDFHALCEADLPALLRLASRHQVQAIQVLDVAEQALPNVGLVAFQDAASPARCWLDTGRREVRAAYQAQASSSHAAQQALFRRIGVRLQCLLADADPFALLQQMRLS
ncbi:hypothetical protein TPL01_03040 [Sulfuriferula plumbiphila]|uniref:DUF58 domain-containing protein n=2 Tax=Sulfuriferula plumbiphila TaxID=171865 RepID=A0A512L3W5_9PROT|nr:hypothetical protein SFPGR_29590 [Sulfuriferula plumbiphila]GEP29166.1 hypothetical protein TPL01_03040 [Sulfuriferula plumbiphila]